MIGPTIIHHGKSEEVYDIGISAIARKTALANTKFGFITDGEIHLIAACRKSFLNAQDLRCTTHFKANCKDKLKGIGVEPAFQSAFLDIIFGENGLIECEDEQDLENRLGEVRTLIDELETCALGDHIKLKFFNFLKERQYTVLNKVIRCVRRNAGLPVDSDNVPVRAYTHTSLNAPTPYFRPKNQHLVTRKKKTCPSYNLFAMYGRNAYRNKIGKSKRVYMDKVTGTD